MAPLISVITVNLNDATGLRATAASVVGQCCRNYEWLVIDGGSTDGSLEVIEAFRAAIDDWSSEPDRGVYDAMNKGLRRARGDYVIFMNAGDRFAASDTVARLCDVLTRHPALDLLFGGTILQWPSGRLAYRPPRPLTWLRHGLPARHQATVIRRSAHLCAPYDLTLEISGDYGAIGRLARLGARTLMLDEPLAIRDCGPYGLSERRTLTRFRDFARVQHSILERPWAGIGISLLRLALVHLAHRAAAHMRSGQFNHKKMNTVAPYQ